MFQLDSNLSGDALGMYESSFTYSLPMKFSHNPYSPSANLGNLLIITSCIGTYVKGLRGQTINLIFFLFIFFFLRFKVWIDHNFVCVKLDLDMSNMTVLNDKLSRAIGSATETGCSYQWCTEIEKEKNKTKLKYGKEKYYVKEKVLMLSLWYCSSFNLLFRLEVLSQYILLILHFCLRNLTLFKFFLHFYAYINWLKIS